jgi:hypothetical protein
MAMVAGVVEAAETSPATEEAAETSPVIAEADLLAVEAEAVEAEDSIQVRSQGKTISTWGEGVILSTGCAHVRFYFFFLQFDVQCSHELFPGLVCLGQSPDVVPLFCADCTEETCQGRR